MAEAAQKKVQIAVESMMDELDLSYMRKMQANMHKCAMVCCQDEKSPSSTVQRCIERCQQNVQEATKIVDAEMTQFQDRLTRCAKDCEDKVKDSMGTDASKVDMSKAQSAFEECLTKCADTNVAYMPTMKKRLEGAMKKLM